ncbi:MAG: hypothetical protein ACFFC3_16170 [Candidatus Odinarchaeota archaeon]
MIGDCFNHEIIAIPPKRKAIANRKVCKNQLERTIREAPSLHPRLSQ